MRIVHPLVGVPCPTFGELLERAEDDAVGVLQTTARLAAWRLAAQDRALAIKDELESAPWSRTRATWSMPPRTLLPADLARALLVERQYLLRDSIFAHEPADEAGLEDARARWSSALEVAPEPEPLPLLRPWARRLALGRLDHPQLRPTARHLVCATLVPQWAELVSRYVEGLVTRDEALDRLHDSRARAVEQGILPDAAIDPWLPPPYLDYFDGIATLEEHLVEGPGALIVGPTSSGRRSLARACQWRHRRGRGPAQLRGHGFNVDRVYVVPTFHDHGDLRRLELPPEMSERCVFALVHQGIAEAVEPGAPLHHEWSAAIAEGLRMSLDPTLGFRLVLGPTPDQHRALLRRFPVLERFPTIEVPDPGPRDTVGLWMCKVFELERVAEGPIELMQILWALSRRTSDHRRSFGTIEDVLTPAPRHLQRWAARHRTKPGVRPPRRLVAALDRLALDLDDLGALVEAEATLLMP